MRVSAARPELIRMLNERLVLDHIRTNGPSSRAELARDKGDQRPDRFAVGEKVDAKITAVDRQSRKLTLTIKGKEVEEEKQAMAEYGSSDSGASLGDILGAAIKKKKDEAKE